MTEVSLHGHMACRREHGAQRTKNMPQERGERGGKRVEVA